MHYLRSSLMAVGWLWLAAPALASPAAHAATDTAGDWTSQRAAYLKKTKDILHDWEGKISEFSARTQAAGKSEDQRASAELNRSWARVKVEAAKLEVAAREDWDNSTAAFERASRDLANRWEGSSKLNK